MRRSRSTEAPTDDGAPGQALPPDAVARAWGPELARRAAAVADGSMGATPAGDVIAELRERDARRR